MVYGARRVRLRYGVAVVSYSPDDFLRDLLLGLAVLIPCALVFWLLLMIWGFI